MNTSPLLLNDSAEIPNLLGRLSKSAAVLNDTLDNIGLTVSSINQSLQKMNIGVTAYADTEFGWETADGQFEDHLLTYSKAEGKWGLRIVVIVGNIFDAESISSESFCFNHAPREARAAAIKVLPTLLRNLVVRTDELSAQIVSDTSDAERLAEALEEARPT